MSEKTNSPKPAERPAVPAEQMRAFRVALARLIEKSRDGQDPHMASVNPDTSEVQSYLTEWETAGMGKSFQPNSSGGSVLLDGDPKKLRYGWVYAHSEDLISKTGILGSFTMTTNESGTEQDIYNFFPDSNIEKIHFIAAGAPYSQIPKDITEHIGWLTPQETEQLTIEIERSHL